MVESEETEKEGSKPEQPPTEYNTTKLKKTLTNNEILANAILFLLAGSETTATTLGWVSYFLALNPDVQERLIQELDTVLDKHNGEITYEAVNEMSYMDMVINETLRMCPAALRLDRVCNKDYTYENIKIPKGQIWSLCIYALHYDPELYPEPEKFDPERFNEDNKKKRENEAFMPFGTGPRNCIGMRFALLEIKFLISTILSKYKFNKCDETPVNLFFFCYFLKFFEKIFFWFRKQ